MRRGRRTAFPDAATPRKSCCSPVCRCPPQAGANGQAMRQGSAPPWSCAALRRAACGRPSNASATGSAAMDAGGRHRSAAVSPVRHRTGARRGRRAGRRTALREPWLFRRSRAGPRPGDGKHRPGSRARNHRRGRQRGARCGAPASATPGRSPMMENEKQGTCIRPRGRPDRPRHPDRPAAGLDRHVRALLPDALDAWRHGGPCRGSEGGRPRHRPGGNGGGRRDRARRIEGRHGAGLCRDGPAGAESDGLGHGRRRPRASCRSGRSRRQSRPCGDRGHVDAARASGGGERSGRPTRRRNRRRSASLCPSRRRPGFGQCLGLRLRTRGRRGRRVLRWRALLRRRRLRDRPERRQHRVRRRHLAAQHGDRARRREVRPGRHALLHGHAPGLHHQVVRARQLLPQRRPARRARGVQRVRTRAGARTP